MCSCWISKRIFPLSVSGILPLKRQLVLGCWQLNTFRGFEACNTQLFLPSQVFTPRALKWKSQNFHSLPSVVTSRQSSVIQIRFHAVFSSMQEPLATSLGCNVGRIVSSLKPLPSLKASSPLTLQYVHPQGQIRPGGNSTSIPWRYCRDEVASVSLMTPNEQRLYTRCQPL